MSRWTAKLVPDQSIPSNVNARPRRVAARLGRLLERHPITLVDVGGRGGAPPELEGLEPSIRIVSFEPNPEAARSLHSELQSVGFREVHVVERAVGAPGERVLHLTELRGGSSLYPQNESVLARYGERNPVERELSVRTEALADLLGEAGIEEVDLLKLDTQGTELEILQSLDSARLESVLFLETEVEFVELLSGQPLFRDVDRFVAVRGFELFHLNRAFWNWGSGRWRPYGRGQIVHGDAIYLRTDVTQLSVPRLARLIALACIYGFADYGRHLFREHRSRLGELEPEVLEDLSRFFERAGPSLLERIGTGCHLLLDRLLLGYLRLRRWNGLRTDSDRRYPTR